MTLAAVLLANVTTWKIVEADKAKVKPFSELRRLRKDGFKDDPRTWQLDAAS